MEQKVVDVVDIEKQKKKIFMKNNNLVKSKYDLTSTENKIYTFLSDKIKRDNDKDPGAEHYKVKFKREETFDFIPTPKMRQANKISLLLSKLMKKTIFIADKKKNGKEFWGEYAFLSYYEYYPETDEFIVDMNIRVSELIVEHYLNGGYTPLNLDAIYNLNSVYAQRFYELIRLMSWTGNKIIYDLSELKSYLLLDKKKSYDNFSNLKKKVIEPAINELNKSGMFKISYRGLKTGNKVTSIELTVEDLDSRIYFKDNNKVEQKVAIEEDNYYVPDKSIFTEATLIRFKKDFEEYDFKAEGFEDVFNDAVMHVMEVDNVTKITRKSYNYFRTVLKTKLDNFDFKRGYEDAGQLSIKGI